ncbi:MAG: DUF4412 domain-containing protein [Bacteroidia bacterium]
MKNKFLKLFVFVFILVGSTASAQSFEGIIKFQKQTDLANTNYVYYVKGDKVRIDELDKNGKTDGSFLVDLKANTMLSLNYDRKLYMDKKAGASASVNANCVVTKTKNVKAIMGYNCREYVVKNTTDNTQISYWIAESKFNFFHRLLKLLNRKDKSSVYIQQIVGLKGEFPFSSVETTITDNKQVNRMDVTEITQKTLDASLFEVPKDFKKFDGK